MTRTTILLSAVALLSSPEAARAQVEPRTAAPQAQRLRRELRAMEALLDQAIAQVSPPNPGFVLAGAPASRGYLLNGHGVVFVLAPRRLPTSPLVMTRMRGRIVFQGQGQARDLRQLEVQVAEFQAQVHQEWQALEQSFDEVQARIWAAAPEHAPADRTGRIAGPPLLQEPALVRAAPPSTPLPPSPPAAPLPPNAPEAPLPASAPEATPPPFPAPPWTLWNQEPAGEREPRAPERVVADTREALLLALETFGQVMTSLPPEETISVVVDFVAGTPFVEEDARPARSLSLRVRKRDLDDRRAGRLSPDALRQRIEATEY